MRRSIAIAVVLACAGCGSSPHGPVLDGGRMLDGGAVDGNGGGEGGGGEGGVCGQAMCSASVCGQTTDACGQTVSCPPCRYSSEMVPVNEPSSPIAMVARPDVLVGYGPQLATRNADGTWSADAMADAFPGFKIVDIAVAPDGTVWLALLGSGVSVAHGTSGAWTVDSVAPYVNAAAIAVGADGTVFLAYSGQGGSLPDGVLLATYRGGAWTTQSVAAQTMMPTFLDVAADGNVPEIVWHDPDTGSIRFARFDGSGFPSEVVDPNAPFYAHNLSMVVDASGVTHVAYRQEEASNHSIWHAVRHNGMWTLDQVAGVYGGEGPVHIAASADGQLAVGYTRTLGLSVARFGDGKWFNQLVVPGCHGESFDLGFEADGKLAIAHECDSVSVHLLTETGHYPGDYVSMCKALSASLCMKACSCPPGSTACCIHTATGNGGCPNPEWYCETETLSNVCGDATQDPSVVQACAAAVSSLTCASGQPGIIAPAACPFF